MITSPQQLAYLFSRLYALGNQYVPGSIEQNAITTAIASLNDLDNPSYENRSEQARYNAQIKQIFANLYAIQSSNRNFKSGLDRIALTVENLNCVNVLVSDPSVPVSISSTTQINYALHASPLSETSESCLSQVAEQARISFITINPPPYISKRSKFKTTINIPELFQWMNKHSIKIAGVATEKNLNQFQPRSLLNGLAAAQLTSELIEYSKQTSEIKTRLDNFRKIKDEIKESGSVIEALKAAAQNLIDFCNQVVKDVNKAVGIKPYATKTSYLEKPEEAIDNLVTVVRNLCGCYQAYTTFKSTLDIDTQPNTSFAP